MALKRLKWLKYLFINREEGQAEQTYWNEKRKKHLAHEHSEGMALGLEVAETDPPSLTVQVNAGRALDTEGNDPEVESVQEIDCSALVPATGEQTVYITLKYNPVETDPYFVNETGQNQNKYVQDSFILEATPVAPTAPVLELARIRLAAGTTAIRNAADPSAPGANEIDRTQVKHTGKEVVLFRDLADVDANEADAFNAMENPSALNPVATVSKVTALAAPTLAEIVAARGSRSSLDTRLDQVLNEDGSFKGITSIVPGTPLTGGGTSGAVPIGISDATPTVRGTMPAADKAKLNGIEAGATADQTAAEILTAVKTVDGAGSGLDADMVDGKHASELGGGGTVDPSTINHNSLAGLQGDPITYFHLNYKQQYTLCGSSWVCLQEGATWSMDSAGVVHMNLITGAGAPFGNHTIRIALEKVGGDNSTYVTGGVTLADWQFYHVPNPAWIRKIYVMFSSIAAGSDPNWWAFRLNWMKFVTADYQIPFDMTGLGIFDKNKETDARHTDLLINFDFRSAPGGAPWGTPATALLEVSVRHLAVRP